MNDLYRLPLDGDDGPVCCVDTANARWFVARADYRAPTDPADRAHGPQRRGLRAGPAQDDGCDTPSDRAALRQLWLYTNTDCNLACQHCFLSEHATRPSLADLLRCAGHALDLGAKTIFLTGGEPFLRGDLERVIAAVAPHARTVVLTNGTLIDGARIDRLNRLGADEWKDNVSFQVSIDGLPAVHDHLRGRGAFDRALAGIRELVDWDRPPAIATVLTRAGAGAAADVTALVASLGLKVHHLFFPHQTGRLNADLVPRAAELLEAVRRCRDVAEAHGVVLDNDAALAARVRRPKRYVSCNGAHDMAAVGADGLLYPCPTLVSRRETGHPAAGDLRDALTSAPLRRFQDYSIQQRDTCRDCHLRFFCGGGCAAYSFWTSGHFEGAEPYCDVYRGLIEDHLRRAGTTLLTQAGGTLAPGHTLRPEVEDESCTGADPARFNCA